MAKSNIRDMARALAGKYAEAEEVFGLAGELLQNIILSPEEQKQFSSLKAGVDNSLSDLSIALSAAAQGKISVLLEKNKEESDSMLEPLASLVDNLSDNNMTDEVRGTTQALIAQFNKRLAGIQAAGRLLNHVAEVANLPANKKKQKKLLAPMAAAISEDNSLKSYLKVFYRQHNLFLVIDKNVQALKDYLDKLSKEGETASPDDDLLS